MIETLAQIYVALCAIALIVAAIEIARRRAYRRKALSYCRVGSDGEIYVTDPQTGAARKLREILVERTVGKRADISPRQRRKVRRAVRQALGAR